MQIEMAALQTTSPLLHGEAVAIDMAIVAELAHRRGLLSASSVQCCYDLLLGFHLPLWHDCITDQLLSKVRRSVAKPPPATSGLHTQALHDATLARDGLLRLPMPTALGAATFVDDVHPEEVSQAAAAVCLRAACMGPANNVVPVAGTTRGHLTPNNH